MVTPYYLPVAIGQAGSAVSVITRDEIERASPTSVAGLLRTVPGVTVTQSGGPGGARRGAPARRRQRAHAGAHRRRARQRSDDRQRRVRFLGDLARQHRAHRGPARAAKLDLRLRRHGRRHQHHHAQAARERRSFSATVEGGSYGTHVERLSGGFAKGDFSMLMSGEHLAIERLLAASATATMTRPTASRSGAARSAAATRRPTDRASSSARPAPPAPRDYDGSPGWGVDPANASNDTAEQSLVSGYGRLSFASPDGHIKQSLTGFANRRAPPLQRAGSVRRSTTTARTPSAANIGRRMGAGAFGQLLAGARLEQEQAQYTPMDLWGSTGFDETATRYALFAGDQISPIDHLFLTFSGRYDGQQGADGFLTGRFTAAYEIPATETKLRASLGTGAKRPTFFQKAYNLAERRHHAAAIGEERRRRRRHRPDAVRWPAHCVGDRVPEPVQQSAVLRLQPRRRLSAATSMSAAPRCRASSWRRPPSSSRRA